MSENHERNVIYETDETGEKVIVRSVKSLQKAYLRFTNKTKRTVDVWWRDFRGYRIHYLRLKARAFFDVTTFITHPWEFTDATTKENYVVGNQRIFRVSKEYADKMIRTNWNITVGMRSLRHAAILKVASLIVDPKAVLSLELPRVLADDLQEMIEMYHKQLLPDDRLDSMSIARQFAFRQWAAYFGHANRNIRP